MAAPKGHKRYGGRTKGVPNKQTRNLFQICADLGCNPFEEMIKIAMDPAHDRSFDALKEVSQYLYPKRKSLEHSGNVSPEVLDASEQVTELNKEDQIKLLEQELKALKNGS